MVEVGGKKMTEKIQIPAFQIHEYSFVEEQESCSSDMYKSRNNIYNSYGQDKKIPQKKI